MSSSRNNSNTADDATSDPDGDTMETNTRTTPIDDSHPSPLSRHSKKAVTILHDVDDDALREIIPSTSTDEKKDKNRGNILSLGVFYNAFGRNVMREQSTATTPPTKTTTPPPAKTTPPPPTITQSTATTATKPLATAVPKTPQTDRQSTTPTTKSVPTYHDDDDDDSVENMIADYGKRDTKVEDEYNSSGRLRNALQQQRQSHGGLPNALMGALDLTIAVRKVVDDQDDVDEQDHAAFIIHNTPNNNNNNLEQATSTKSIASQQPQHSTVPINMSIQQMMAIQASASAASSVAMGSAVLTHAVVFGATLTTLSVLSHVVVFLGVLGTVSVGVVVGNSITNPSNHIAMPIINNSALFNQDKLNDNVSHFVAPTPNNDQPFVSPIDYLNADIWNDLSFNNSSTMPAQWPSLELTSQPAGNPYTRPATLLNATPNQSHYNHSMILPSPTNIAIPIESPMRAPLPIATPPSDLNPTIPPPLPSKTSQPSHHVPNQPSLRRPSLVSPSLVPPTADNNIMPSRPTRTSQPSHHVPNPPSLRRPSLVSPSLVPPTAPTADNNIMPSRPTKTSQPSHQVPSPPSLRRPSLFSPSLVSPTVGNNILPSRPTKTSQPSHHVPNQPSLPRPSLLSPSVVPPTADNNILPSRPTKTSQPSRHVPDQPSLRRPSLLSPSVVPPTADNNNLPFRPTKTSHPSQHVKNQPNLILSPSPDPPTSNYNIPHEAPSDATLHANTTNDNTGMDGGRPTSINAPTAPFPKSQNVPSVSRGTLEPQARPPPPPQSSRPTRSHNRIPDPQKPGSTRPPGTDRPNRSPVTRAPRTNPPTNGRLTRRPTYSKDIFDLFLVNTANQTVLSRIAQGQTYYYSDVGTDITLLARSPNKVTGVRFSYDGNDVVDTTRPYTIDGGEKKAFVISRYLSTPGLKTIQIEVYMNGKSVDKFDVIFTMAGVVGSSTAEVSSATSHTKKKMIT